mmetsp:Transcript_60661/g.112527  ORF Transcript_60661/g.112527 Transcript_60661/m.112527 type:complete len:224 (+) Transcript_60661:613-1284(+)
MWQAHGQHYQEPGSAAGQLATPRRLCRPLSLEAERSLALPLGRLMTRRRNPHHSALVSTCRQSARPTLRNPWRKPANLHHLGTSRSRSYCIFGTVALAARIQLKAALAVWLGCCRRITPSPHPPEASAHELPDTTTPTPQLLPASPLCRHRMRQQYPVASRPRRFAACPARLFERRAIPPQLRRLQWIGLCALQSAGPSPRTANQGLLQPLLRALSFQHLSCQ